MNEPLWVTLLGTGLRFGEVATLKWSDVDLDGHSLTVRHTIVRQGNKSYAFAEPKTRSSRRLIPMPPAVVDALRRLRIRARELQLLARDWPDLDLVFSSHIGTPIRETNMREHLHELEIEREQQLELDPMNDQSF
ncbi:MAG: tyrosine-type recombinase/integrase [Chloroflexota bacterium]